MNKFFYLVIIMLVVYLAGIALGVGMRDTWSSKYNYKELIQEEKIIINYEVLAQIESSNNPFAFNPKSGAIGLYQITPIVLQDCYLRLFNRPATHDERKELYDPKINFDIARWYLEVRIPEMLKHYKIKDTLEHRLIAYNAGIKYLVNKKELPEETREYLKKYKELSNEK